MALRRILTGEDPALRSIARPVTQFNRRLNVLLDDLKETMYRADGLGLAACQVGILRRVLVIDVGDGPIEMINPEIVLTEGEQGDSEGCLSFPGQAGYVIRPEHVIARAQNRHGEWVEYDAHGIFARAIMHEVDHLDGLVFLRLVTAPPEGWEEEHSPEEQEE